MPNAFLDKVSLGRDSSGRPLVVNRRTMAMLEAAERKLGPVKPQIHHRCAEENGQRRETSQEQALSFALNHPTQGDGRHGAANNHRKAKKRDGHFNSCCRSELQSNHHASWIGDGGDPLDNLHQASQAQEHKQHPAE